ncbi:MAG TPA: OmpH family outer membrane protein [Candidatus Acidoferrales bacterium]
MKKQWLVGLFPLLLPTAMLAQSQPASGQAAPATAAAPAPGTKVGIINIQLAIINVADGKKAAADLQSQFAPRRQQLDNLRKELAELRERLQAQERTLSDEARADLARQIESKTREFNFLGEGLQKESQDAEGEVVRRIGQKMMAVIDKYSREHGYSLILDVSSQQTPVIYAATQLNITDDIIQIYDTTNPVTPTAAPAPAKPAVPKPAAATQPPPRPEKKP